jgi:mono/diheme cytochrome c family protein
MTGWVRRGVIGCAGLVGLGAAALGVAVGFLLWTWDQPLRHPETPFPALSATTDPAAIERGRYLVHGPAHCDQCHSADDREHPERIGAEPLHGGLAFELGPIGTLYARNLTPDPTGIGGRTDADLARVMRAGVLPEGELSIFMRYSAANLSDDDVVDVLSYLRSLPPVAREVPQRELTLPGKLIVRLAFGGVAPRLGAAPAGVPAGAEPSVARGEYLADHVMLCTACHTEYDPATFTPVGPKGGGGTVEPSHGRDSDMEFAPPNLTASPNGVVGRLDEAAFVARMRAGRAHASSIMPWESFATTTEADLRSVYRYLHTLPPVDRDLGPSYRPAGWTGP